VYSDLGSQKAPLISEALFREFVFPYVKRFADAVHGLGGKLFFHSCGMVFPFIEGLIEAGVDILDPIQPCTEQMQPENLARYFCGRVCFHGGVDVQQVLSVGTPDNVRASIARYKKAFENCGFICAPSHFLQVDAPVENILALYEECMNDK
jgi:uroporphyrinogen decarboxylase